MNTRGLLSVTTDKWSTLQNLFDELDSVSPSDFDTCATPTNAECKRRFMEVDDAPKQTWTGTDGGGRRWFQRYDAGRLDQSPRRLGPRSVPRRQSMILTSPGVTAQGHSYGEHAIESPLAHTPHSTCS